jgi:hypothetical protein
MDGKLVPLSLESLGNGGAMELFNHELEKVLRNCMDVNTDHKFKRSVFIEMKVQPDEKRETAAIKIEVGTKLASPRGLVSQVFIGEEEGRAVAVTFNPQQVDAFMQDSKVHPISRSERKAGT